MNKQEILQAAKNRDIAGLDIWFTDLFGSTHHVTLAASGLSEKTLEHGVGFDGSSVPGFKTVQSGDMRLVPDLSTAVLDPFWDMPTVCVIGKIVEADTGKPFEKDPRAILIRAEEFMRSKGIAQNSIWGPEYEFFLWHRDRPCHEPVETKGGYHARPPRDEFFNIRAEMVRTLEAFGVKVKYHHHEVGPCQQEIETLLAPALVAGDWGQLVKYVVHMIAWKNGLNASFAPKPVEDAPGNGMHFHQMLMKDGVSVFYGNGYHGLSDTALFYMGGILKHARALCAITNPSAGSYKRLRTGFEAPSRLFFSAGNRTAALRIPKYATSPEVKRVEYRVPDASCNIYLAQAAQLMAGIDGILNQIEPVGPFDKDVADMTHQELAQVQTVPNSVEDAMQALRDDHDFLMLGQVFPRDFVESWCSQAPSAQKEM